MKKTASKSKSTKKTSSSKKPSKNTKKKSKKVAIGSMNGLNWDKRKKRG